MKKRLFIVLLSGLFAFTGCGRIKDTIQQYLPGSTEKAEITPTVTSAPKERVYMDELKGVLENFDGSYLRILSEDISYVLDLQNASLECGHGMVRGDEISVIYEGQLNGTDTSGMHALKVVDGVHKKSDLTPRLFSGVLKNLTPNTVTVISSNGITVTFPTAGSPQYYANGIKRGGRIYVRYKGVIPGLDDLKQDSGKNTMDELQNADTDGTAEDSAAQAEVSPAVPENISATMVKVLSVSNTEAFTPPVPTPTPAGTAPAGGEKNPEGSPESRLLRGHIQSTANGILYFRPNGSGASLSVNISSVPCYFPSGISISLGANLYYTGEWSEDSLDNFHLISVTGDDTGKMKPSKITSIFSGTIVGSTADTFTIQTGDGALLTCRPGDAPDESTGSLAVGSDVKVTFNPSQNPDSNIYQCLRIRDA